MVVLKIPGFLFPTQGYCPPQCCANSEMILARMFYLWISRRLDALIRILHENADNGVYFIKSVSESVCSIGLKSIDIAVA